MSYNNKKKTTNRFIYYSLKFSREEYEKLFSLFAFDVEKRGYNKKCYIKNKTE